MTPEDQVLLDSLETWAKSKQGKKKLKSIDWVSLITLLGPIIQALIAKLLNK